MTEAAAATGFSDREHQSHDIRADDRVRIARLVHDEIRVAR